MGYCGNCKRCNKKIHSQNVTGYCRNCLQFTRDEAKIRKWKETGDTSCQVQTTLRNCIREYILDSQARQCAICSIPDVWEGKELKFVLDHIDGNAANNWENNLRLVCPNCDSQLDTYKSKNKNSARDYRRIT